LILLSLLRTPLLRCALLFPYTTLFRSVLRERLLDRHRRVVRRAREAPGDERVIARDVHLRGVAAPDGRAEERRELAHLLLRVRRSEEHTSELQSPDHLVCRLLLEKKNR